MIKAEIIIDYYFKTFKLQLVRQNINKLNSKLQSNRMLVSTKIKGEVNK